MTDNTDIHSLYVLICSLIATLISLPAVWYFTAAYAPGLVAQRIAAFSVRTEPRGEFVMTGPYAIVSSALAAATISPFGSLAHHLCTGAERHRASNSGIHTIRIIYIGRRQFLLAPTGAVLSGLEISNKGVAMPLRAKLNILAVIGLVFTAFIATALLVYDMVSGASNHARMPDRGVMSQVIRSE